jgi:hypothetical protein
MKRIALICVWASLIAATASARPTLVQAKYGEAYPSTKISVSFDTPVTAGSLIVAGVRPSNGGLATITFGGRTLTKDARTPIVTVFSYEMHSLVNAPGGATTVTATVTGPAGQERMWIAEFSGVAASNPLQDTSSNGAGVSESPVMSAGAVTTVGANALIVCTAAVDTDHFGGTCASQRGECDPDPGVGYTMVNLQEFDDDKTAFSYGVFASAGSHGCSMTSVSGSPNGWSAIAAAYKPSGDGGGGSSTQTTPAAPTHVRISP